MGNFLSFAPNVKGEEEIHKAWDGLKPFLKKTRKGETNLGNTYYYERDHTHGDIEVYRKQGSKGKHIGSVRMEGGKLYKPAVVGRSIRL